MIFSARRRIRGGPGVACLHAWQCLARRRWENAPRPGRFARAHGGSCRLTWASVIHEGGGGGIEEAIKWGMPAFTYRGKIVCGLGAFKAHCALWFHEGKAVVGDKMPDAMGEFGQLTASLTCQRPRNCAAMSRRRWSASTGAWGQLPALPRRRRKCVDDADPSSRPRSRWPLVYQALADAVLVVHLGVVAFNVAGLVAIVVGNFHCRGRGAGVAQPDLPAYDVRDLAAPARRHTGLRRQLHRTLGATRPVLRPACVGLHAFLHDIRRARGSGVVVLSTTAPDALTSLDPQRSIGAPQPAQGMSHGCLYCALGIQLV